MSHFLIHRGLAKKTFAENTLSSFKYCFKKIMGLKQIFTLQKIKSLFVFMISH